MIETRRMEHVLIRKGLAGCGATEDCLDITIRSCYRKRGVNIVVINTAVRGR